MGRFTTRDIILSLICFACFLAALVLIAPQVHAVEPTLPPMVTQEQASRIVAAVKNLSESDWSKLPGAEVTVSLAAPVVSSITLAEGQKALMIPFQGDQWGRPEAGMFNYIGNPRQPNWSGHPYYGYALFWTCSEKGAGNSLIISGKGTVSFAANLGTKGGNGQIRVKVVMINPAR